MIVLQRHFCNRCLMFSVLGELIYVANIIQNIADIRLLLPGGLLAGSKPACWYCVYLVIQKWVFRPTGATQGSDEGEIWHGKQTVMTGANM